MSMITKAQTLSDLMIVSDYSQLEIMRKSKENYFILIYRDGLTYTLSETEGVSYNYRLLDSKERQSRGEWLTSFVYDMVI